MNLRTEYYISKCLEGRAPREVLEELEADIPDATLIRKYLVRDLKNEGVLVDSSDVSVDGSLILVETERTVESQNVLDTYTGIYPEFEFILKCNSDTTGN